MGSSDDDDDSWINQLNQSMGEMVRRHEAQHGPLPPPHPDSGYDVALSPAALDIPCTVHRAAAGVPCRTYAATRDLCSGRLIPAMAIVCLDRVDRATRTPRA
jgi:hypothetical protein